jgi:hyperosmotically inducible periplasmic protein
VALEGTVSLHRRWFGKSLLWAIGFALFCTAAWPQSSGNRSQDQISKEVRHALITLPSAEVFDDLTFRVDGSTGTVTLMGQVIHPVLKSAAEKAVKQIGGVRSVINHIEVLPASQEDSRIRLGEYVATYGYSLLNQYAVRAVAPVHIIVKSGNVTLVGTVDNQMDKSLFFTQASSLPGVVSMTDHLQVSPRL